MYYVPASHFSKSYREWVVQLMIQWDTEAIAFRESESTIILSFPL